MKCTGGGCDFATTCARQMETHKEQRHHDAYQPVLRCSSCQTWFARPTNLKSHNADKHQGERRFKCDRCGSINNKKGNFIKHQKNCEKGTALGNRRMKQAEPTIENLHVKKESPHAVYRFGSKIGEGGFGKVYEAVKKGEVPSVKYAIKEVGPKGGKSAELEAKRMRQFEHKNLMALLEFNCQGTHGWVAPEVTAAALKGITGLTSAYTQMADMYSVGVMAIDCFLPRETLPTDFFHKKKVENESFAENQLQRIEDDRHLQLSETFKSLVTRCLAPMTTRLSAAAQKLPVVKNASVEPFKELVAECLKAQKEKKEKRSGRRRKPTTVAETSSLFSPPTPRSRVASTSGATTDRHLQPSTSSGTSSLFSAPAQRSQQAPMSTGMSSLFSAAPASSRPMQPTANTAWSSLFPASGDGHQHLSTCGGMSSLFARTDSASSRP